MELFWNKPPANPHYAGEWKIHFEVDFLAKGNTTQYVLCTYCTTLSEPTSRAIYYEEVMVAFSANQSARDALQSAKEKKLKRYRTRKFLEKSIGENATKEGLLYCT